MFIRFEVVSFLWVSSWRSTT